MTTAKAITNALAAKGIERTAPGAIYLVLMDGPRSVCFTESMLDTWFLNLTPEQKAEICEHHHDGPAEIDTTPAYRPISRLKGGIAEWLESQDIQRMSVIGLAHDFAQRLLECYVEDAR